MNLNDGFVGAGAAQLRPGASSPRHEWPSYERYLKVRYGVQ
jgi:hypothetical protein